MIKIRNSFSLDSHRLWKGHLELNIIHIFWPKCWINNSAIPFESKERKFFIKILTNLLTFLNVLYHVGMDCNSHIPQFFLN